MRHDWQSLLTLALILLSVSLVVAASIHDLVARTVPNWIAVVLAALGLALHSYDGHLVASLTAGLVVFLLTAICWKRGWLGGADVKLLAATSIIVPPASVLNFITAVAIADALLGVGYLAARRLVRRPDQRRPTHLIARILRAERWRISRGGPLPYACAIACGFLFVLL